MNASVAKVRAVVGLARRNRLNRILFPFLLSNELPRDRLFDDTIDQYRHVSRRAIVAEEPCHSPLVVPKIDEVFVDVYLSRNTAGSSMPAADESAVLARRTEVEGARKGWAFRGQKVT